MRRALLSTALVLTALIALAASPARAQVSWVVGADFHVGNAYFSLGYQRPAVRPYGYYEPVYYYRVRAPLRYDGVHCTSSCYLRDGYYYHHPSCPVVARHFQRYDFYPSRIWASVGIPYRYGGYHAAPRPYYRHDYRRYDHRYYDRRHYDRRYDSHGRGHGWGHSKGRGRGHHEHGPHCHH